MVDPISSNNPMVSKQVAAADQAPVKPPAKPESAPFKVDVPKTDVVELSLSAQAKLLKQQGMSIAQIAIQLGLDVETVSGFFG
jgi:hypothetical protein